MRNNFRMMLLSMAALGLFGCSDKLTDDIATGGGDIGGETGYLSFRIKSANTGGMTRAAWKDNDADEGDYSVGVEAQGSFAHEDDIVDNIQANRVFFFNEDGTYHSSSFLSLSQKGTHNDENHSATYGDMVYSATVKRTGDRGGEGWPKYCLVILNGRPSRLNALLARAQAAKPADGENGSFDMPQFLSWVNEDFRDTDAAGEGLTLGLYNYGESTDGITKKDKYYFTMTNSVFLDGSNKKIDATEIKADNFQPTSEKAAENPITVYVERIMSKVEAAFTGYNSVIGTAVDIKGQTISENGTGYFGDNTSAFVYSFGDEHETESKWFDEEKTINLKAIITNWTINAVEYQTNLFKNIDFDGENTTWTENSPFNGWNDYNHHRSYWAIDSHYEWNDGKDYPTQYRKSYLPTDKTTINSYENDRNLFTTKDWAYGEKTAEGSGGNDIMNSDYKWALDYKAFNKVTNKRAYKYCLENTFGKEDGLNYQNMIMGSHLLVLSRLITADVPAADGVEAVVGEESKVKEALEGMSESDKKDETKVQEALDEVIDDKYYYSDRYYDKKTYINRQLAVINEALGENIGDLYVDNLKMWDDDNDPVETTGNNKGRFRFDNIAGGLWIQDENTKKYKRVVAEVNEKNKENEIAATEVFGIAPAYIVKGDGKVTIALNGEDSEGYAYNETAVKNSGGMVNLYYVKYNELSDGQPVENVTVKIKGADGEITEETVSNKPVQFTRNQLVSLIYQVANTADCFKNGRMYYTVPVQHFNAGKDAEGNDSKGDYVYKYDNVKTGDYGIVRNHWYQFTINKILKPGVPVHDPDQPIIPNYDEEDRYIGFEVVILPWHVVDNGNVTLGQ